MPVLSKQSLHRFVYGRSFEGRKLEAAANFDPENPGNNPVTLISGGLHGDEKATVVIVEKFIEEHLGRQPAAVAVAVANPDGDLRDSRYNARGIDLNRNCDANWTRHASDPSGAHPWSEPESRALRDLILRLQPAKIICLHWALAEIDADGAQSAPLARAMWHSLVDQERRPYRLRTTPAAMTQQERERHFAYCPGSFGQWCGYFLSYPGAGRPAMITLELPFDEKKEERPPEIPHGHLDRLHALWRSNHSAYLAAVEPAALTMLEAACQFEMEPAGAAA